MIDGEVKSALVVDKFGDVDNIVLDDDMQSDLDDQQCLHQKVQSIK